MQNYNNRSKLFMINTLRLKTVQAFTLFIFAIKPIQIIFGKNIADRMGTNDNDHFKYIFVTSLVYIVK